MKVLTIQEFNQIINTYVDHKDLPNSLKLLFDDDFNYNCHNVINCKRCYNCINCKNCINCIGCVNCIGSFGKKYINDEKNE